MSEGTPSDKLCVRRSGAESDHVSGARRGADGYGANSTANERHDECNDLKPVLKSFWVGRWWMRGMKQRRKAERAAANRRGRGKVNSVVAMFGLPTARQLGMGMNRHEGEQGEGMVKRRARCVARAHGPEAARGADEEEDEDDARGVQGYVVLSPSVGGGSRAGEGGCGSCLWGDPGYRLNRRARSVFLSHILAIRCFNLVMTMRMRVVLVGVPLCGLLFSRSLQSALGSAHNDSAEIMLVGGPWGASPNSLASGCPIWTMLLRIVGVL